MNAHGRNCQTAGSAGRTPQAASLPNQTLFLVFFLLQNPTAPAAPGEGAQMSMRWLAREASRGPGCAEESQVSFEEQEVGQHSAVIREEPQGWGRGNLVPRAPLIILRFTSKVSGGGGGAWHGKGPNTPPLPPASVQIKHFLGGASSAPRPGNVACACSGGVGRGSGYGVVTPQLEAVTLTVWDTRWVNYSGGKVTINGGSGHL